MSFLIKCVNIYYILVAIMILMNLTSGFCIVGKAIEV
jgi:hypothetical protein